MNPRIQSCCREFEVESRCGLNDAYVVDRLTDPQREVFVLLIHEHDMLVQSFGNEPYTVAHCFHTVQQRDDFVTSIARPYCFRRRLAVRSR